MVGAGSPHICVAVGIPTGAHRLIHNRDPNRNCHRSPPDGLRSREAAGLGALGGGAAASKFVGAPTTGTDGAGSPHEGAGPV